jgi:archaemetzincin
MAFRAIEVSRRAFLAMFGLLLLANKALGDEPKQDRVPRLVIVPIGDELAGTDIDFVRRSLEAFFNLRIEVIAPKSLPQAAFYAPRKRYRAEKLLTFLDTQAPKDAQRVVGLTAVDISTSKGAIFDWGVLGLATIDGRVCVLSKFRCGRGTRTAEQALVRYGKTAVHEVGHTLGLDHCPTAACLMEDAKGTVTTTDREYDLCPRCRARLRSLGRAARDNPTIPWPKP